MHRLGDEFHLNKATAPCPGDEDQVQPKARKRQVPHAPTANQFSALARLWRIEGADRPGARDIGVVTDRKDGCSDCISDQDVIGGKPTAGASNRIPERFL